jgi:5-methylcytosine-specific restriction enzyme A
VLLKLYSVARWRKFREHVRATRILCEMCTSEGRTTEGVHVHHIKDPRDRPDLMLDEDNVKLLCPSCHSSHHASEKGKR